MTLREAGVTLIDCVHATPAAVESGYPYIGIPQMKDGRLDFDDARKISDADFIKWTVKTKPQMHDIVLSRRTNPGVIAPVRDDTPFALGQNLVLLRASGERVSPGFLRWLASSPLWWDQIAKFINVGAVFDSLRCADVPNFELPVPPIADQEAISGLLSALDDKIELNRRMNETLEAQARVLFRDWFVDFGPVKAKMAGDTPYLAPDVWSLFPIRLDDDGVPEGWKRSTIGASFNLTMGQSPPGDTYNDDGEGLPFFQGRTDFGFRYPENRKYCDAPKRVAEAEDTLVSVRAPVGDINLAWEKSCVGRGVAAVRHKSGSASFTYYSAAALRSELEIYQHTGTVFGAINKKQFEALKTVEPDMAVLKAFDELVGPIDQKVRTNELECRTLTRTRDLLLPKLMSGEIRVGDMASKEFSAA
ncbi:restriction endonuclease subunit S [Erythrobacter sp. EC-HK427]|uniref:restriction endonuclease subunit S n=1 Tax=Erythrobacter sp. EC-HK427 TaxID=2038396 RepID=UPI0018FE3BF8|nr:restriction endonuclease subunit S [Erythrobacter sp. EC-HK427]